MSVDPVGEWFSRRRLGLFLHFGIYAIEGWHEQDQMRRRIPRREYVKLADRFDPVDFDADRILDLAEAVGMEYVCLTSKHHDGFCLWDTKQMDYNVMNSPYGRDIVGQLAEACHRREFAFGLYYSIADWYHPSYPNEGRHHELPGPEPGDEPDWDGYLEFLKEQVRELCSGYGKLSHFFWDMNVPEHEDRSINEMIRSLQPNVVINDRGFDEGDFGTPEREYQKDETDRIVRFDRPTEACNSVGTQSWGWRQDEDYYSTKFLTDSIAGVMAKGGNFLLNVGPDDKGAIPDKAAAILDEIAGWYRRVEEAFGDTSPATELTSSPHVLLTRCQGSLYVVLLAPERAEAVVLPPLDKEPVRAILLNTGEELRTSTDTLPAYWASNSKHLTVKGLPRDLIGRETLVLRLDFDGDIG